MSSEKVSGAGKYFDPKLFYALAGFQLKARYLVEGFLHGLHESPFHGFSVEFSEYRNYQPGDELKHLDWRLYARTDRLYVKKFEEETNVRFYLLMDGSGSMEYRGAESPISKMECAQTLAASLSWLMLRQNDAIGFFGFAQRAGGRELHYMPPSQKPSQFGKLVGSLGECLPSGGPCLGELLQRVTRLAHRRSVILIFSDLLEPSQQVEEMLKELRFQGHEIMVIQILDRDEVEFPFQESKTFVDLEDGKRRQISPGAIRETYLKRFHDFMKSHYDLLNRLEIQCTVVRTDESPLHVLGDFLSKRKRLK